MVLTNCGGLTNIHCNSMCTLVLCPGADLGKIFVCDTKAVCEEKTGQVSQYLLGTVVVL